MYAMYEIQREVVVPSINDETKSKRIKAVRRRVCSTRLLICPLSFDMRLQKILYSRDAQSRAEEHTQPVYLSAAAVKL